MHCFWYKWTRLLSIHCYHVHEIMESYTTRKMQRKGDCSASSAYCKTVRPSMRSQGPASHWIPWTWTHVVSRKQLRIAASKLSSASSACLLRYIELCEDQAMSFIQGLFGLGHGRRCFGPFCQTLTFLRGHLVGSGGMHASARHTPDICRAAGS